VRLVCGRDENRNGGLTMTVAFEITEEQRAILNTASAFVRGEVAPRIDEFEREEYYDKAIVAKMGEFGLVGGAIPEQYGGLSLDYVTLALLLEELASVDVMTAVIAGWPSCSLGRPIYVYGSEELKQKYLKPLCEGRIMGATGVTEPHSGTDIVRRMETTVRRDGDHYILNGTKIWISNARNADFFLTYGTIDKEKGMRGICAFIVDRNSPGLTVTPILNKAGARSQDTGQVFFDQVRVPASNMLLPEGEGYKSLMCGTEIGRLACATRANGQIRACLDASVKYAKDRMVFGQAVGRYQLIQSKIADMRVGLDASRLLTRRLALLLDSGVERCQEEASIAKLFATDTLMRAAEDAYQIHGAYGAAEEYGVGRIFRDAKIMQIYDGANEMHRQIIGEWEMGYRQKAAS
jgi:alkylation response protein AidB-like acyl-CoA dehydrogenase